MFGSLKLILVLSFVNRFLFNKGRQHTGIPSKVYLNKSFHSQRKGRVKYLVIGVREGLMANCPECDVRTQ